MRRASGKTLIWTPRSFQKPGVLDFWPVCKRCNEPVHAYWICDEGSRRVEVAARCTHGSDPRGPWRKDHFDALRIEWNESEPPSVEELEKQIQGLEFFDQRVVLS